MRQGVRDHPPRPKAVSPVPGRALIHMKDADEVDLRLGAALVEATLFWPRWVHRRVDSVHVLEGENGRRRQSIDCRPLDDARLAYTRSERDKVELANVDGQIMIPLMYVTKGPLRHFDASKADGSPMPILGTRETARCGVAMVVRMLHADRIEFAPILAEALLHIAGPNVTSPADDAVVDLLERGLWRGKQVVHSQALSDQKSSVRSLIETLSASFLLVGLLDSSSARARQILKISYHWHIPAAEQGWGRAVLIAAGFKKRRLRLQPDAAAATSSYHLEVRTPREAQCVLLQLPGAEDGGGGVDATGRPTAHVYMSFKEEPSEDAVAIFRTPLWGLRGAAVAVTLFCLVAIVLALTLDDAKGVWRAEPDGPATVLLVGPALFFTFLASRGESALMRRPLTVLRLCIGGAGLSLLLIAASLVGRLDDGWIESLWIGMAVYNGVVAAFLLVGIVSEFMSVQKDRSGKAAKGQE